MKKIKRMICFLIALLMTTSILSYYAPIKVYALEPGDVSYIRTEETVNGVTYIKYSYVAGSAPKGPSDKRVFSTTEAHGGDKGTTGYSGQAYTGTTMEETNISSTAQWVPALEGNFVAGTEITFKLYAETCKHTKHCFIGLKVSNAASGQTYFNSGSIFARGDATKKYATSVGGAFSDNMHDSTTETISNANALILHAKGQAKDGQSHAYALMDATVTYKVTKTGYYKFDTFGVSDHCGFGGNYVYFDASSAIEIKIPPSPHTLKYDANGGFGAPAQQSATNYSANHIFTISDTKPARIGYTFQGWSTSSTATSAGYQPGYTISVGANATTTLYAIWKPTIYKYTLRYDANGGAGLMNDQEFENDKDITLLKNQFTKTGYLFESWNTKTDGTATRYEDLATTKINLGKIQNINSIDESYSVYKNTEWPSDITGTIEGKYINGNQGVEWLDIRKGIAKVTYTNDYLITGSVKKEVVVTPPGYVFIMDASGSISNDEWGNAAKVLKGLLERIKNETPNAPTVFMFDNPGGDNNVVYHGTATKMYEILCARPFYNKSGSTVATGILDLANIDRNKGITGVALLTSTNYGKTTADIWNGKNYDSNWSSYLWRTHEYGTTYSGVGYQVKALQYTYDIMASGSNVVVISDTEWASIDQCRYVFKKIKDKANKMTVYNLSKKSDSALGPVILHPDQTYRCKNPNDFKELPYFSKNSFMTAGYIYEGAAWTNLCSDISNFTSMLFSNMTTTQTKTATGTISIQNLIDTNYWYICDENGNKLSNQVVDEGKEGVFYVRLLNPEDYDIELHPVSNGKKIKITVTVADLTTIVGEKIYDSNSVYGTEIFRYKNLYAQWKPIEYDIYYEKGLTDDILATEIDNATRNSNIQAPLVKNRPYTKATYDANVTMATLGDTTLLEKIENNHIVRYPKNNDVLLGRMYEITFNGNYPTENQVIKDSYDLEDYDITGTLPSAGYWVISGQDNDITSNLAPKFNEIISKPNYTCYAR